MTAMYITIMLYTYMYVPMAMRFGREFKTLHMSIICVCIVRKWPPR